MRIGIMLRHYGQHGGGVWIYTRNLLRELIAMDTGHQFVLIYRDPEYVGTFEKQDGVKEVVVKAAHTLLWDQFAVRRVEKEHKLDLIFNPKYSLPLMAKCRTVFVSHGCNWHFMPEWKSRAEGLNHRYLEPRYARKADAIIAVSDTTKQHLMQYLGVPKERIHTIYLGVGEEFLRPACNTRCRQLQDHYQLPERFYLYVGQIYPPKNFGRLIQAYARVGPKNGLHLVVAGTHTSLCEHELVLIEELGLSDWVTQLGWIEHNQLPVLYSLADALIMPSLYEACPSPPLEAMGMSCPVVTANRFGTKDVSGDAALFVDPESVDDIADGMRRIISDAQLRNELIEAGQQRVKQFSWKKCAKQTLEVFETVFGS